MSLNSIPDDVLNTHILPLATMEWELRDIIKELTGERDEFKKTLLENLEHLKTEKEKRNKLEVDAKKNAKLIKYYKNQVEELVGGSRNYTYDSDDDY